MMFSFPDPFGDLASLPQEIETLVRSFVRVERLLVVSEQGQVLLFDLLSDALVAFFEPLYTLGNPPLGLWLSLQERNRGPDVMLCGSDDSQDCPRDFLELHLSVGGAAKQLERNPGYCKTSRFFGSFHEYSLSCEQRNFPEFMCDKHYLPNPYDSDVTDECDFMALQLFDGPLDQPAYRSRNQVLCVLSKDGKGWDPVTVCPQGTEASFYATGNLFALSRTGLQVLDLGVWIELPETTKILKNMKRAAAFVVPVNQTVHVAFCDYNHKPQFVQL